MKNSFLLVALLCSIVFLNSCKKDKDVELTDQERSEIKTQSNTHDHDHSDARRTCGSDDHMAKLMQNPEFRKAHQAKLAKIKNMPSTRAACSDPVILPIAVHFQGISNPDESCLRQLAQSQIDILNADYGGTNSDITTWTNTAASYFPGVSNGEACIQFCIATQNHPSSSGISNGDPAVTINAFTGDSNPTWSGYLNIFVIANTGVLGYSPLGGSGNGDGVVIDANAFGAGSGCGSISPNAPYDLGRTLTHELGHYLLLDHIWGGGCGQDDGVNDTPDSADSNYGCPNLGASTCNSNDMHMNYMDYTNDACMYMFSAGQATRMENYVNSSLQNLINNGATVCQGGGGTTPTCTDGIQNGQETGVDCGGPDCQPCQTAPTCTDGIQNGEETGVDCGGPDCQPCQTNNDCDAPTNVGVNVASESTAIVIFDGTVDAFEYIVTYEAQGGGSQSITTSDTYVILDNLMAETTYSVQVQAVCQEGPSDAATAQFTTPEAAGGGSCECGEDTHIQLGLTLDNYPEETAWQLTSDNGETIASGSDYQTAGEEIDESICLADGCYTFYITDSYGDGICCSYGDGSFTIADGDDNVLASGGDFGEFAAVDICIDNGEIDIVESRKAEKNLTQMQISKKAQTLKINRKE